jgi:hypothetical protein
MPCPENDGKRAYKEMLKNEVNVLFENNNFFKKSKTEPYKFVAN